MTSYRLQFLHQTLALEDNCISISKYKIWSRLGWFMTLANLVSSANVIGGTIRFWVGKYSISRTFKLTIFWKINHNSSTSQLITFINALSLVILKSIYLDRQAQDIEKKDMSEKEPNWWDSGVCGSEWLKSNNRIEPAN